MSRMMTEQETADAMRISDLFAQILFRTLNRQVVGDVSDLQLSFAQAQALRYIWLHSNVLIGDIASGLSISYPSATNMVKRLERRGYATRHTNPADRREVEVRLTSAGESLVEAMENERVTRLGASLGSMDPEDRDALMRGLRAFVTATVLQPGAIAQDICLRCGAKMTEMCPVYEALHEHQDSIVGGLSSDER